MDALARASRCVLLLAVVAFALVGGRARALAGDDPTPQEEYGVENPWDFVAGGMTTTPGGAAPSGTLVTISVGGEAGPLADPWDIIEVGIKEAGSNWGYGFGDLQRAGDLRQ